MQENNYLATYRRSKSISALKHNTDVLCDNIQKNITISDVWGILSFKVTLVLLAWSAVPV